MFKWIGSKKHPKGPDWSKARQHCLDLSGTKVFFTVPEHTDLATTFKPKPEKYNIYDETNFWKRSKGASPISFLEGGFAAGWQFNGFPLIKELGCIDFCIAITRDTTYGSLHKPEHLVFAINQRINNRIGPLSGQAKDRHHSRLRWAIQTINKTPLAYYEEQTNLLSSCFWETPISDEHYISFVFHKHIYKPNDLKGNDYLHKAYDALIEKIINSIHIEWSADAIKQQADAKEKWPDESLPESLPELTWPDEQWLAHESEEQKQHRELLKEVEGIYAKQGKLMS